MSCNSCGCNNNKSRCSRNCSCNNNDCDCRRDDRDIRNFEDNSVRDICVDGVLYKISTVQEDGCLRVFASPCTLPSVTFEVAQVCKKRNNCMQFDFFEAQVFTDPVVFIIDCNLCQIIKRAIEIFLDEVEDTNFKNSSCRNNNSIFGF